MIDIPTLITFLTASMLLCLAPGPDNIFVLTQSMLSGPKAGIAVTLGLCSGLLLHTGAVTLGVAIVFQTSALAFTTLKLIGAAYLLYLAVAAFRAGGNGIKAARKSELSGWGLYRRGIFMNITNPKVALFFLAFLPQFADPSKGVIAYQLLLLGGLFIVASIVVFTCISLLAGQLRHWFNQSATAEKLLHRIAGTIFAGFALKLIFTQR